MMLLRLFLSKLSFNKTQYILWGLEIFPTWRDSPEIYLAFLNESDQQV